MVVIQFVRIIWNKDSRGGKEAQIRNKIPQKYKLPIETCEEKFENTVFIHNITLEYKDSKIKTLFDKYETCDLYKIKDSQRQIVDLSLEKNELNVSFDYANHYCGAPYRYMYDEIGNKVPLKCKAFKLKNNEYGKIELNERFSCVDTGTWWYELRIANIIKTDNLKKSIFINNKEDKLFSKLELLK